MVKNLFDLQESQKFVAKYPTIPPDLALRIYTSRLIGQDPDLVLHGGGNTSVKLEVKNVVGEEQEVLYIKGSGIDLATIEPLGFVGLELAPLRNCSAFQNLPMKKWRINCKFIKSLSPPRTLPLKPFCTRFFLPAMLIIRMQIPF